MISMLNSCKMIGEVDITEQLRDLPQCELIWLTLETFSAEFLAIVEGWASLRYDVFPVKLEQTICPDT